MVYCSHFRREYIFKNPYLATTKPSLLLVWLIGKKGLGSGMF